MSAAENPRAYEPVAQYYEASDCVEYVREDVPAIHRRVDEILTLVLALDTRNPIGFQLKGFRHFYLKHLRDQYGRTEATFIDLVQALEAALGIVGEQIFQETERKLAYEQAKTIAAHDKASLHELPQVA